ncbi:MAG: histone deacetylase [Candidatus Omnitrophica bacterium]|nr:histone deacetylase [Candidatus Omnitrophota bacterium]
MKAVYSPIYCIPLPERHPFPMEKFPELHRILLEESLLSKEDVVIPEEVDWEDLRLVHTDEYLEKLREGKLSVLEQRRMGLPWSEILIKRSRTAVSGTILATGLALEEGIAAHLAGGTHHAFADRGEGYCVLNDVAVGIRRLQRAGKIERALVIDFDVHQGNGTASIFEEDPSVYTFSVHGERNYPIRKSKSDRDVGLPDQVGDDGYLEALQLHLPEVIEEADPDLICYLAGVDVVEGDRFGRINLTREGLRRRDRFVLETVKQTGIPLTLLLSGGYAKTPTHTADLHATVHREAAEVFANGALQG